MSKLQRFGASVAEIFIFGSLGFFVWQFSDWVANRNIDCTTAVNFPYACYNVIGENGINLVKNPNYHFSLFWFVVAMFALALGAEERGRLGSPFSGQSRKSVFAEAVSGIGFVFGAFALLLAFAGLFDLFAKSLTPGSIIGPEMWYMTVVGWLVIMAIYCLFTWSSLPKPEKPSWRSVSIEEQFKDVSLADLIDFIEKDFSDWTKLTKEYELTPTDELLYNIKIFEEALGRALSHFYSLENQVELHYLRLRAKGDHFHQYQELLNSSALIRS